MQRSILVAAVSLLLVSVILHSRAEGPAPGMSRETAVIVAGPQSAAIAEEWHWIVTHFPGASMLPSERAFLYTFDRDTGSGVHQEIVAVTFVARDATEKTVYFDVRERAEPKA